MDKVTASTGAFWSLARGDFACRAASARWHWRTTAFSLLELLVVIAIMIIVASLASAAFSSMIIGSNLNRGGLIIADQIAFAQQTAVARNREIEVRFFYLRQGGAPGWRGIQLVRIEDDGSQTVMTRMSVVPDGICISADSDLSPLLMSSTAIQGTASIPSYGNLDYRAIRFRPNGSVSRSIGSDNFLTLQQAAALERPLRNFYTVQVNPVTGKVTSYRP